MILTLRATKPAIYDNCYHQNLRDLISVLAAKTRGKGLKGPGGFMAFSNLIPPTADIDVDSRKTLVISSPDTGRILSLMRAAESFAGKALSVGGMEFELEKMRPVKISIPDTDQECGIITGTPLVLKVRGSNPDKNDAPSTQNSGGGYWRKEYPLELFVKHLEENMLKKYGEFSGKAVRSKIPIIERFNFRKQLEIPVRNGRGWSTVIGSMWDFRIRPNSTLARAIAQFSLDAGLGEMNDLGFGFMNLMKELPPAEATPQSK